MTTQASMALMPIVSVINNHVTALSTDVAKYFGKNHFHVVRDIEKLIEKLPTCRASIFGASEVQIASNLKNAPAKLIKAYRMTRDGFTLLVMGWTGEKALQFKLAWLDAFNRMEEQLRKQQSFAEQDSTLISNEQQNSCPVWKQELQFCLPSTQETLPYSALHLPAAKRF